MRCIVDEENPCGECRYCERYEDMKVAYIAGRQFGASSDQWVPFVDGPLPEDEDAFKQWYKESDGGAKEVFI